MILLFSHSDPKSTEESYTTGAGGNNLVLQSSHDSTTTEPKTNTKVLACFTYL